MQYIYIITESRQGDVFLINNLIKKTSPCFDSVIIYQNQHVDLTIKLCFFHHIYGENNLESYLMCCGVKKNENA